MLQGPSQQNIWDPNGSHIDFIMGPRWVTHVVPTWKVQPVLAWVPYGLLYGSNMGPTWAQHGTVMGKHIWVPYRFLYGPQMGNPCGTHMESATGIGMGPIRVKIWVQHGTLVGTILANRYRTIMGKQISTIMGKQVSNHCKSGLMLLRHILTNYLISF